MAREASEGLSGNHQRHLLSIFKHVDDLLSEAALLLTPAGSRSPFASCTADASPVQSKVIEDYIRRVRQVMIRFLQQQDIPLESAGTSAVWAVRTSLLFADSSVEELRQQYMKGYGELNAEATQSVEDLASELQALLRRMRDYLAQGLGRDPQARLQRLEGTRDEVRLLQKLESIITERGLVELRPTLSMLVDRLESNGFEVAVFGRVSSGKSSLLNYILKSEFLPVGVTPITAVPTRIGYGEKPGVTVRFAEDDPIQIELSRLAEFATEQQNPGNHKHVTHIRVQIPESKLRDGVTFVDTPGLGSLATSGAVETRAYLPRCDLGIILIDAASTLTEEDLAVVRMLYDAGATAMVLLSKADLLTPSQRKQAAEYVHQHLVSDAGVDVPVCPVSVVGSDAKLVDDWFEHQLLPLFEKQKELATLSLRRKIDGLREAVMAALRSRIERQTSRLPAEIASKSEEAHQALTRAGRLVELAGLQCGDLTSDLGFLSDQVLEATASLAAEHWRETQSKSFPVGDLVVKVLLRVATETASNLTKRLAELRSELLKALQMASGLIPEKQETEDLPEPANLPVLDTSSVNAAFELRKPLLSFLGKKVLYRHALSEMKARVQSSLETCLQVHRKRLNGWSQTTIADLRKAFEARAEYYRLRFDGAGLSGSDDSIKEQVESLKELGLADFRRD